MFWFHQLRRSKRVGLAGDNKAHVTYGTNMETNLRSDLEANVKADKNDLLWKEPGFLSRMPIATKIHSIHHRYAYGKRPETSKDLLVYHGLVLMEWDHGQFTTVMELATLNGMGGRFGKTNWCHDRLEKRPLLYKRLPACMVLPWKSELAEIRCYDHQARNIEEFKQYLKQYEGPFGRFVDWVVHASYPVRLRHRTQADVMQYLCDYITRDRTYSEKFRHCQAFAADFLGFMAGKSGVVPTTKVCSVAYKPRHYLFLYDPDMYLNASKIVETLQRQISEGDINHSLDNFSID